MNPNSDSPLPAPLARVALLVVSLLLAFGVTVCGVSGLLARWNGESWLDADNLSTGMICGLMVWLVLARLNIRQKVVQVSFEDRFRFVAQLRKQLGDLGYEVRQQNPDHLVSRPTFASLLFGGRLHVFLSPSFATLSGPRLFVDLLGYRLRLFGLIQKTQIDLDGSRRKQTTDRYLRRVAVTLRLRVADLPAVHERLTELLGPDASASRCEMQLMLQKEGGISEYMIDHELRDWLRAEGIGFDLQKDLIQWEERRPSASDDTAVCVNHTKS